MVALQWSRARSSAEIVRGDVASADDRRRFNGAALDQARKYRDVAYGFTTSRRSLQWSRARSSAEIVRLVPDLAPSSVLQWSRARSSAEMQIDAAGDREATSRFNGAALDQARKCRGLATAACGAGRFNGAALDQARKSSCCDRRLRPRRLASMEPRSIKRGNSPRPLRRVTRWSASMEPRSIKRGNAARRAVAPPATRMLQWSRARSSAEMRARERSAMRDDHASMEPRSIKRGNPLSAASCARSRSCFNGAALDQARKSRRRISAPRSAAIGFNGAALDQARKSHSASELDMSRSFMLQWSRARSSAEIRSDRPRTTAARVCFNGAALDQARK